MKNWKAIVAGVTIGVALTCLLGQASPFDRNYPRQLMVTSSDDGRTIYLWEAGGRMTVDGFGTFIIRYVGTCSTEQGQTRHSTHPRDRQWIVEPKSMGGQPQNTQQ